MQSFRVTCYKCKGSGHYFKVCPDKKEDAKSNAVAVVEEKEDPEATNEAKFLSVQVGPHIRVDAIKQRDELTRIGNLDWDKELKHWVRRKPRGMAQMRVDVTVLTEDQKF